MKEARVIEVVLGKLRNPRTEEQASAQGRAFLPLQWNRLYFTLCHVLSFHKSFLCLHCVLHPTHDPSGLFPLLVPFCSQQAGPQRPQLASVSQSLGGGLGCLRVIQIMDTTQGDAQGSQARTEIRAEAFSATSINWESEREPRKVSANIP